MMNEIQIEERWRELEGESRVAVIRLGGILFFYAVELVNFLGLNAVDADFHSAATALTLAWSLAGAFAYVSLKLRVFPVYFKYVSTSLDFLFLTGMLILGNGPGSPLLPLYFLLLALTALRMSLPLLWFGIASAIVSYSGLVFFFAALKPALSVPPYYSVLFVASLAAMGVLCGQIVRGARRE